MHALFVEKCVYDIRHMSLHPIIPDIFYQKERKMIISAVQAGAISDIFDIKACNII